MKPFVLIYAAIFLGFAFLDTSFAIIRRHDREDLKYIELGSKFPAVTRFGGGTATLIDPHWLVTAGHVAANMSPFDRFVEFNGKSYEIEGIVIHPQWLRESGQRSVDIALVRLKEPVEGVEPVLLYPDQDEVDKEITFVGIGMTGDGQTGPLTDDGKLRGATNTVSNTEDHWLVFAFDAPPGGTELEGISGPGDSGGPALLEKDGKTFVLGISSFNNSDEAAGPCCYGSTEYYARVSSSLDWLQTTMQSEIPPQAPGGEIIQLTGDNWPDGRAAEIAAAFFKAYAQRDDAGMEQFETNYRAQSALQQRSVADRINSWRDNRAVWGELVPWKCVLGEEDSLYVLVKAEGEGVWKSFQFLLEPDPPHRLSGIGIASPIASGE